MAKLVKKKPKSKFNEQQQEVINFNEGACLVVAVAGAGKTTAVVHRIDRILKEGIASYQDILATTFTKKAAGEMNDRLKALGNDIDEIQVSTFHSICYKVIREELNIRKIKYDLDATGSKAKSLLKFILGYQNMDWKGANLSEVEGFISGCKNSLIRPHEVNIMESGMLLKQAYQLFEKFKEERGFLTFDDLPIRAWEIFNEHPEVLEKWQSRFKFVIVDEYQDSNKANFEIMKLLAYPENNIMVVGDDDQSIYGFRGAVPDYMLSFEETFNSSIVRMEKNYRCPKIIQHIANPLIHCNIKRLSKTLSAEKDLEGVLQLSSSFDFDEESINVLEYIKTLPDFESKNYKEIAILYRTNAQSRALEDRFILEGIPYELVGGFNFYQRKEIKDILHYFYAGLNYQDKSDEGFERIINVPFRYLGKAFLDSLASYQKENKISFESALKDMPSTAAQSKNIDELLDVIQFIRQNRNIEAQNLISMVVNKINYYDYLAKQEGDSDGESNKSSNIKELIRASSKFSTVEKFIDYIEMLNTKKKKKGPKNKVILSTIHRAKGLEWNNVIVVGMNEMILPHGKNNIGDGLEEERRLAYVAVTRSKEHIMLSHVQTANIGGGFRELKPSRFLNEMRLL
jgi:DNA helicase-2/ATP-dependent DNA helicase PcrA